MEELFSWRAVAEKVAAAYEDVIAEYQAENQAKDQKENKRADR